MATKKQLVKAIQEANGGSPFITRKRLAEIMSLADPGSVGRYLYGLQAFSQRYFIEDIVEKMLDECKWNY